MNRKPRKPINRCDFCGQRVAHGLCVMLRTVDTLGFVEIRGIAHKECAEKRPQEGAVQ